LVPGHSLGKNIVRISFFIISSSNLKYKLMRLMSFNKLPYWIPTGLFSFIFT